jgi:S-formylglutathione hydrolase FrmB
VLPWSAPLAGTLNEDVISSELLRGNPLGDPYERPLWVYTPPGYAADSNRRYPSVYVIQGFTGFVSTWKNRSPFRQPFVETADEVRTAADRDHRAIMGKSSGGFGAMITPMLRPDLFSGLATHAGDALYELCTVDLPFDPRTGVLRPDVWQRWLAFDPVRMAPTYAEALRSMRSIWIDAGTRDDYFLDVGAEAFRNQLRAIEVDNDIIRFELFDASHAGIDYRYPLSLAWICQRMAAGPDAPAKIE